MLFYLDNWQSAAPEGATHVGAATNRAGRIRAIQARRSAGAGRRQPRQRTLRIAAVRRTPADAGLNENYARELMELHTLGVDGGYTQKDVQEVARAFTGWTIANPRQGGGFLFEPRMHDDGEKIVLGHKIKAGGGQKDGEQVLDILAAHPVDRAVHRDRSSRGDSSPTSRRRRSSIAPRRRFRETDGDIREVVRTIVTSPEFFARRGVSREGEDAVRVRRQRRARDRRRHRATRMPLVQALRDLGMPLYGCQPPTGLRRQGRRVGQHRRAAQPHELRASRSTAGGTAARRRQRGRCERRPAERRRSRATTRGVGARRRALGLDTRRPSRKATTPSQALALVLGSPEFQRR